MTALIMFGTVFLLIVVGKITLWYVESFHSWENTNTLTILVTF